jgi:hypothetical protein
MGNDGRKFGVNFGGRKGGNLGTRYISMKVRYSERSDFFALA